MKYVYIESGDWATERMFASEGWTEVDDPRDADLICFTGGSDVSPELYGEVNVGKSHTNVKRDLNCVYLWSIAKNYAIPTVGICRGGQFINVMNGGKMEQHIDGHNKDHPVFMPSGSVPPHLNTFMATSVHHQHMIPDVDGVYEGVHGISEDGINEVILYDDDSLCFQPHPEYSGADECREVFFYLIDNYLMSDNEE